MNDIVTEVVEMELPQAWICMLAHGDSTGLSESEIAAVQAFIRRVGFVELLGVDEGSFVARFHDADRECGFKMTTCLNARVRVKTDAFMEVEGYLARRGEAPEWEKVRAAVAAKGHVALRAFDQTADALKDLMREVFPDLPGHLPHGYELDARAVAREVFEITGQYYDLAL